MKEKKEDEKPNVVTSVFERVQKKRLSSLFTHKAAKTAIEAPAAAAPSEHVPVIKKRFPLGLDIGSSSIKLLQLGLDQQDKMRVISIAIEEIPKMPEQNLSERERKVSQLLKKMVDDIGLAGEQCYVSAPYFLDKINLIILPQMPLGEIDRALQYEIKELTQMEAKDTVMDYVVLENQKTRFLGEGIGVLAVTAAKKDMFEYLALLEGAGLSTLAIDVEGLAALAGLEYTKKIAPREVVLSLDFGAGKTSLDVISDMELVSTRSLNITGNSLTKVISSYCNVPWEEAEGLKKKFGISGSPEGSAQDKATQVKNALLPTLENMAQDIEQAFKYFSYRVTKSQITRFDRIILSGGSAHIPGLNGFLSNRMNVKVDMLDALSGFSALDTKYEEKLSSLSPRLNVALGLALRGIG